MTLSNHDQHVLDCIFDSPQERPLPIPNTATTLQEAQAIKLFESGSHQAAIDLLSDLISTHPTNPSLYNNRAQMRRLLHIDDTHAVEDCLKAIELCGTEEQWRGVKRQSLLQLGWLRLRAEGEAAALPVFQEAAALGSVEGKRMAARCNPYAAMCNQMLCEIMSTYFSI